MFFIHPKCILQALSHACDVRISLLSMLQTYFLIIILEPIQASQHDSERKLLFIV